ncbi:MAG: radical SAM protein [Lachnospiraceae bacterium]|nr:radical SAM protein [Lachnospiraceae bacterium]
MSACTLCPRECLADRTCEQGFCGGTDKIRIARAALHFYEEPCISGSSGSGAVFFTGCPLRCVFCQNRSIALSEYGEEVSPERLSEIFFELREQGANNINLVTPTHEAELIIPVIERAKKEGLDIPFVYNTGSYEKVEVLRRFEGLVDVWLPDLKYYSPELSAKYSNAPDYFEVASKAIEEMVRQAGEPVFSETGKTTGEGLVSETGLIKRGVIVRHLVLPGCTKDSKAVIDYLYKTYGNSVYISIMNQYTPLITGKDAEKFPELTRRVTKREYAKVVDYAIELGVENAYIQEGKTAEESFIPAFDGTGVKRDKQG